MATKTLLGVLISLLILAAAGCKSPEKHTPVVAREMGVLEYFGPGYWRSKVQVQSLIQEGHTKAAQGEYAFAIGKLKQAYRISPQETHLPLEIARNYARIATQNGSAQYEKQKALEWLYRAFLVDEGFGEAVFRSAEFRVLENEEIFKTLKKNFGVSSDREVVSILGRLTAMARETQVVMGEVGEILRAISVFLNWVGFPVLALVALTLFTQWFFFQFGFPRGFWTTALGFFLSSLIWMYGNRIYSGGAHTGFTEVFKVSAMVGGLLGFIFLGRLLLNHLGRRVQRRWRKTRIYHRYFFQRSPPMSGNLKDQWLTLEELHRHLDVLMHQYVLTQKPEEREDIFVKLEALRRQIHEVTAKPWKT